MNDKASGEPVLLAELLMRGDTKEATQYKQLKRHLAVRFKNERLKYLEGKADFMEGTLAAHSS